MKMIYVRGADAWAVPAWERPVNEEVRQWTEMAVTQTERMRRFKPAVALQIPQALQRRLGLKTDKVTLTVNGQVSLSLVGQSDPFYILQDE